MIIVINNKENCSFCGIFKRMLWISTCSEESSNFEENANKNIQTLNFYEK